MIVRLQIHFFNCDIVHGKSFYFVSQNWPYLDTGYSPSSEILMQLMKNFAINKMKVNQGYTCCQRIMLT
jgi:hypothetical protein